ncbi:hypothetical protein OEZ85_011952 [Tetradesmus obliquus]|uniref:dolichyl-phosphate-mannose--protein mannosyltransferase n=1 Tax=Tetradesmus obliquus TaxID=3088 RepID=A0ABY8TVV1_TETOB|nr:hypothetical protein OEZ85_011952 [Tetradesmus obliquus]
MQKQQQKALSCSSNTAFYIVGLLAVFVYVNTLIGDFTFDDNFAVITNGDVTNNDNPVSGLFKHDFWGQDITSSQSHKSYRPVTILAFRIIRQAWDAVQLLVPGINGMLPSAPQQQQQQQQKQQSDTFGAKSPRPAGLHAFPFHVLSVALHALVSMLVLALVQHLFAKLEMAAGWAAGTSTSSSRELAAAGAEGAHSSSRKSSMIGRLLMWQNQPELWLRPVTWAGQAQALAAAVLFALHPAHTEAVAGVVGCAELICAAWSIPALLLYFMAVDGSWVAVQQLVAIYRKVENPIPFADSFTTRLLSTGFLHARYFGILLFPRHLSADWSFSCIPLVEQLSDPRNAATAALYLYFLYVGLAAPRTVLRNADWWDEERLFLAAERVCPNSAKVQQNCGVLQRRYANFSSAMQHFKRAQEIEPGYCEPSYWIALTRINQGEVLPGIAAMRASLGCKYTAAEALQTLNRLYVMMHENNPGDPMPMLEWAGVLASRDVLRVADGCATAEDAALMAALAGKSANYVSQALDVCTQGLEQWEAGGTPSDTLASLARDKYSSLNTTLLRQCVSMRRAVYKKLTTAEPKSQAAKKTLYKYISKVQQGQPGCRTLAGGGNAPLESPDESVRGPSSHQKLLHRFQSADPEDPWLQLEWGATLLALGGLASLRDAAMHLEVSSAIFNHIVQELQPDSGAANQVARSQRQQQKRQSARSKQLAGYTALDGKTKLTPIRALEAAMLPLEQFKAAAVNATSQDGRGLYCEMLKRLCHLRLQMVVLVQQLQHSASNGAADGSSGANGGGSGSSSGGVTAGLRQASSIKALLAAKAAGRRCLVELSERRGCEQQAEEIRRLIGRGTD